MQALYKILPRARVWCARARKNFVKSLHPPAPSLPVTRVRCGTKVHSKDPSGPIACLQDKPRGTVPHFSKLGARQGDFAALLTPRTVIRGTTRWGAPISSRQGCIAPPATGRRRPVVRINSQTLVGWQWLYRGPAVATSDTHRSSIAEWPDIPASNGPSVRDPGSSAYGRTEQFAADVPLPNCVPSVSARGSRQIAA